MLSGYFKVFFSITVLHFWTANGTKMIPLNFDVKRSKFKHCGGGCGKTLSGLFKNVVFNQSHCIAHVNYQCPIDLGSKGQTY
jgi:hypothetical protein